VTVLNTPTLIQGFQAMLDGRIEAMHTAMPARVESYDSSEQRVSVKPIVRRAAILEDDTRDAESLPIIEGVPVLFPGAGSFKITFPISKGDIVLLIFSEGSLDKWLDTGAVDVDPDDDRRNALTDAIAIPGLLPFAAPTDQVDSSALVISAPEIKLGSKDASNPIALKSDLTALKTYLDTHVHGGVTTGAGISAVPTISSPAPTASTKVKAE